MDAFKKVGAYVSDRKLTIGKFLMIGGSAVALNLLLLFLMVRYLGFNSPFGENLANALAMELSIIYNFFMSRKFTWRDRPKKSGKSLFLQILGFHVTIGATILLRIILFWWLQRLGVFYILNATIGIGLAAAFDFLVYDNLIFKKGG